MTVLVKNRRRLNVKVVKTRKIPSLCLFFCVVGGIITNMKDERLAKILETVDEKQSVSFKTLAKLFYVSDSTLRRDLAVLESEGRIIRSHGYVLSLSKQASSAGFLSRKKTAKRQKTLIAKAAVEKCLNEGDVVMLDASSTAAETVSFIKNYKDVIVMTSGIETLMYLAATDLKYYSSGGQAYNNSYSFIGQTAIDTIKTMNADVCFVSCHGLSENGYVTDISIFENDVRAAILKQSRRKVLLIDSTKINNNCYSNLCHVSFFDDVFCDKPLPTEILATVKNFHLVSVDPTE